MLPLCFKMLPLFECVICFPLLFSVLEDLILQSQFFAVWFVNCGRFQNSSLKKLVRKSSSEYKETVEAFIPLFRTYIIAEILNDW